MYYRVAIQGDAQPPWKWQSTALSSLGTLLQWLQVYRAFPQERLRIFSSASPRELNEQLARENQGQVSGSVTAAQFLQERLISPQKVARAPSEREGAANQEGAPIASSPLLNERNGAAHTVPGQGTGLLERRRLELELGRGGDHDVPYTFAFPTAFPPVKAWIRLQARVAGGQFQP